MQHKYLSYAMGLIFMSTTAIAQEFYFPTKTGQARSFIPEPKQYGNFNVLSSLDASLAHNDNIFATETNKQSDLIWVARPQVRALSDFEKHALNLSAAAEKGVYTDFSNEDYLDYNISADGRIDVLQSISIPVSIAHRHDHFRRLEIEDLGGIEPTRFDHNTVSAGINYAGPMFRASVISSVDDFDHRNSQGTGNTIINNSGLNRKESKIRSEIGLSRQADISPYVYSTIADIEFDNRSPLDTLSRDATISEYGAGANVNLSSVTSIKLELADATRKNDDPQFSDFNTLNVRGNIKWQPLQTLTGTLDVYRGFENTILLNSIASIDTNVIAGMEYEIAPEFQLDAGLGYFEREFQDIALQQNATLYNASLGGNYKFTPNIWIRLGYIYTEQEVERQVQQLQLRNFTSNTFTLTSTFYY